jgi:hypothetical protein
MGYVYFEEHGTIALLAAYAKNDEADIPMAQRAAIKAAFLFHRPRKSKQSTRGPVLWIVSRAFWQT